MIPTTPSGTRTRCDSQAVGPDPAVDHLADRVGQAGHRAQPVGHGRDPLGASRRSRSSAVASAPARSAWATSVALASSRAVRLDVEQIGGNRQSLIPGSADEVAMVGRPPGPAASSASEGSAVIGTGSW